MNSGSKSAWRCGPCKAVTATKSRSASETDSLGAPTIDEIKKVIQDQNAVLMDKIEGFQQCLNFLAGQIDDLKKTVKDKDAKLEDCIGRLDAFHAENVKLKEENDLLKNRMSHLESYSRLNCVEIQGVPEPQNEDTLYTVTRVANAINFKLEPSMIDTCHRLRGDPTRPDRQRGIILKFVSRLQKEQFMRARAIKRFVTTKDLDPTTVLSSPIYINESLSPDKKKLYSQCRTYKRDNNIQFLWIKQGQIKMRKAEKCKVFNINSIKDLNDVH